MKNYLQEKFGEKMHEKTFEKKKPLYFLNLGLFACIIIVCIAYFVQINNISSKGYEIRDLEKSISVLEEENKNLALEIVNLQSLDTIKEKSKNLELVSVQDMDYLAVTSSVMAKR